MRKYSNYYEQSLDGSAREAIGFPIQFPQEYSAAISSKVYFKICSSAFSVSIFPFSWPSFPESRRFLYDFYKELCFYTLCQVQVQAQVAAQVLA